MKRKSECPHDRQQIVIRNGQRIQMCCACRKTIGKPLKNA